MASRYGAARSPLRAIALSSRALCLLLFGGTAMWIVACTTIPKVQVYYVDEGVVQYYVLSTELNGPSISADVDFSYRNAGPAAASVTCNFAVTHDEQGPRSVTGASFVMEDGMRVFLTDLKVLFVERAKRSIRISSQLAYDDFVAVLTSRVARFEVVVDGRIYQLRPSRRFLAALDDARTEMLD